MLSKVFKAYDIRSIYPDLLDETVAEKVGWATGKFLLSQIPQTQADCPKTRSVVVGRDMRKSSPSLAKALSQGLISAGANVIDVGMVDTSFIYFAINHLGCCGGVMTTASHNPPQYNGFKISGLQARPVGADSGLKEIQALAEKAEKAEKADPVSSAAEGEIEVRDLWDDYKKHVLKFMELDRPLKVVVDASNGMAGVFVPKMFDGCGKLEIIPINFETTGEFVHEPNPLLPENMVQTQEAIKANGADLGVCFDGDADRCMVADENGEIVGCDLLGAVMAQHFLRTSPGSAILHDLRASKSLVEAIKEAGGTPVRSRVGHVFMKKMLKDNDGVFGAELSGHMYYKDNFFTDSGAITFATVLSILSGQDGPLSGLIKPFARYAQSGEINFEVEDKDGKIELFRQTFSGQAKIDDLDGITVDAMDNLGWWFNVRKSNTEPFLRLNLEARDQAILSEILDKLKSMLV